MITLIVLSFVLYAFGWWVDAHFSQQWFAKGYGEESSLIRRFGMTKVKLAQLAIFLALAITAWVGSNLTVAAWFFLSLCSIALVGSILVFAGKKE